MRSPFSLFIRNVNSKKVWYARFYDEKTGEVFKTKSTGIPCTGKKGRKIEAYKVAEQLCNKLNEAKAPFLIPYLESFWKPDSQYATAKRIVEKKPLSEQYIRLNALGIQTLVKPYKPFQNLRISDLKPGMIEDWKIWSLENGKGIKRVNDILQAMRVSIRYMVTRGDMETDPFRNVKKIPYTPKEKGILNQNEVKSLIDSKEEDSRVKLAVLLAVLSGLRRGEVRGLRWKDIDSKTGLINVENNFVDGEGSKPCKWGSDRQVILSETFIPLFDSIRSISPCISPEDFILFNINTDEKPCSLDTIRAGFKRMLKGIGITTEQQKERNLTFHGMRHTFITLARLAGLPDITVQALAGHKSAEMMNHYSHAGQVIDFKDAREKMQKINIPIKKGKIHVSK